jgi:opacity protein-like surface antigen
MFRKSVLISVLLITLTLVAGAQQPRSEVSIAGSGAFTKDSSSAGISESATNAGGFFIGYRFNFSRWIAAEASYGYSRNTQNYFGSFGSAAIQSNVHITTGAFVLKLPTFAERWRPYALAGGGAVTFDPKHSGGAVTAAATQTRGAFLYGGGIDFDVARHVALRAEYRGYVYQVPTFDVGNLRRDATTHLAQPSAGIVFRF